MLVRSESPAGGRVIGNVVGWPGGTGGSGIGCTIGGGLGGTGATGAAGS